MNDNETDRNTPSPARRVDELVDGDGNPLRFEDALGELETLVERMEAGELSLEQSVADFERGMRLHQFCQQALEVADQKVQILVRRSEEARAGDFEAFNPIDDSASRAIEADDDE